MDTRGGWVKMKFVVVYAERSIRMFGHATLKRWSPPSLWTAPNKASEIRWPHLPRACQRTWAWRCVQNPRFTYNACLRGRKFNFWCTLSFFKQSSGLRTLYIIYVIDKHDEVRKRRWTV